jgi:hypothetical protein
MGSKRQRAQKQKPSGTGPEGLIAKASQLSRLSRQF